MRTADENAAKTRGETAEAEPLVLRKEVDRTTYTVAVHFSKTSKETMEDKILRLIEREVSNA
jgi:hypothetical protein